MKKGTIVTFFCAGGAGGSTVQKGLSRTYRGGFLKTGTTRPARGDETDEDYNFYSPFKFSALEEMGKFLWTTPPVKGTGYRYCGEQAELDRALKETGDYAFICILPSFHDEICRVLADYNLIRIHLLAPAPHEHFARLKARGDSGESIRTKMDSAPSIDREAIARNAVDPTFHLIEPCSPIETKAAARRIMVYGSQ